MLDGCSKATKIQASQVLSLCSPDCSTRRRDFDRAIDRNSSSLRYSAYFHPLQGWCNVAEWSFYGFSPCPTAPTSLVAPLTGTKMQVSGRGSHRRAKCRSEQYAWLELVHVPGVGGIESTVNHQRSDNGKRLLPAGLSLKYRCQSLFPA